VSSVGDEVVDGVVVGAAMYADTIDVAPHSMVPILVATMVTVTLTVVAVAARELSHILFIGLLDLSLLSFQKNCIDA
jgi:hypothetical protein